MIRTDIGHVQIELGDSVYSLIPSFANISKIDSPKQIVTYFQDVNQPDLFGNPAFSFARACRILNACGLPDSVTGGITFSQRKNKAMMYQGKIPVHDVFVLAAHCLKHGIVGVHNDSKKNSKAEPITEFNASKYMQLARKILGCTISEAAQMTMTEFVMLADAEIEIEKESNGEELPEIGLEKQQSAFAAFEARQKEKLRQGKLNG